MPISSHGIVYGLFCLFLEMWCFGHDMYEHEYVVPKEERVVHNLFWTHSGQEVTDAIYAVIRHLFAQIA